VIDLRPGALDDANALAACNEQLHEVRANEASPAGDDGDAHAAFFA
jgi:hypothetical protein